MIKYLAPLLFLFVFTVSWSREEADSTKTKELKASANVSVNSNGIAYIPAFSLDEPAIVGAFSLEKGRFSYDPILSYTMDLKPWIVDNWLHYRIVDRPSFEFKVGGLFSAFFSEYETEDEVIWQAQKYFAFELIGTYKFNPLTSLSFTYLHDMGQDPGTLTGDFFNLQVERTDIPIGKKVLLSGRIQTFYLNYTGNNDGLFLAGYLGASLRNIPFSVFFQAIQALESNTSPFPGFKWNLGLSYSIKTP
jgi:hypothetical protein